MSWPESTATIRPLGSVSDVACHAIRRRFPVRVITSPSEWATLSLLATSASNASRACSRPSGGTTESNQLAPTSSPLPSPSTWRVCRFIRPTVPSA